MTGRDECLSGCTREAAHRPPQAKCKCGKKHEYGWEGRREREVDEKSGALGDVKGEGGGTAKVDAQDGWLCR